MAAIEVSTLTNLQKSTLAISYAALLCNSGEVDFNNENVQSILKASGVKVDNAMVEAFVKSLEGKNISELFKCGGGGGAAGGAAAGGNAGAKVEEKEAEKGFLLNIHFRSR